MKKISNFEFFIRANAVVSSPFLFKIYIDCFINISTILFTIFIYGFFFFLVYLIGKVQKFVGRGNILYISQFIWGKNGFSIIYSLMLFLQISTAYFYFKLMLPWKILNKFYIVEVIFFFYMVSTVHLPKMGFRAIYLIHILKLFLFFTSPLLSGLNGGFKVTEGISPHLLLSIFFANSGIELVFPYSRLLKNKSDFLQLCFLSLGASLIMSFLSQILSSITGGSGVYVLLLPFLCFFILYDFKGDLEESYEIITEELDINYPYFFKILTIGIFIIGVVFIPNFLMMVELFTPIYFLLLLYFSFGLLVVNTNSFPWLQGITTLFFGNTLFLFIYIVSPFLMPVYVSFLATCVYILPLLFSKSTESIKHTKYSILFVISLVVFFSTLEVPFLTSFLGFTIHFIIYSAFFYTNKSFFYFFQ